MICQTPVFESNLNSNPCSCGTVVSDFIAYYPLCTDSLDCKGNYNGTDNGTLVYDGKNLDTSGGYVSIGSVPELLNTNIFSFSMWVNMYSINSYTGFAISFDNGQDDNSLFRLQTDYHSTGSIDFGAWDTGDVLHQISQVEAYDTFNHIACIGNANVMEMYINGILVDSISTQLRTEPIGNLYLGARLGGNLTLNGQMGRARIYNRALSQAEVNNIFNYEKGDYGL